MKRMILAIMLMVPMTTFGIGIGQDQNQGQLQGQVQGQLQGQAQGQSLYNRNMNRNSNYNRNSNSNRNINRNNANSNSKSDSNSYSRSAGGTVWLSNDPNITFEGSDPVDLRDNTPDAYAPPLTTSNGTCMGSSSVGGSGPGLGLSVGTTWADDQCSARYNAKMLHDMGYQDIAVKIMCQIESVAKAAGAICAEPTQPVAVTSKKQKIEVVSNNNGFF